MDWLRQNKPSLNVAKCEYMLRGKGKQLAQFLKIYNNGIEKGEIKRVN